MSERRASSTRARGGRSPARAEEARLQVERRPSRPGFAWPAHLARRLGKIPDHKVAEVAGIDRLTVVAERKRRGIPPFRPRRPPTKWTDEMIALLGTASDRQVAAELDLSVPTVFGKRRELGIPPAHPQLNQPPRGHVWEPEEIALLGRMTDAQAAELIGIRAQTARRTRRILGIPAFVPPTPPVEWTAEIIALLGTDTDTHVAARLGVSTRCVQQKRSDLGIPPFIDKRAVVRTPELADLLRLPTTEIQRRTRLDGKVIAALRREYGIERPRPAHSHWTAELEARLGQVPDRMLAAQLGITRGAVLARRQALGIPAWRRIQQGKAEDVAILGTMPDEEVARRTGRTTAAVRFKRYLLGLPRFGSPAG